MALQFIMALLILKTTWGASAIQWCGTRLQELVKNGEAGSEFIFGPTWREHRFAFGVRLNISKRIVAHFVFSFVQSNSEKIDLTCVL